jgi:hypothetical protein
MPTQHFKVDMHCCDEKGKGCNQQKLTVRVLSQVFAALKPRKPTMAVQLLRVLLLRHLLRDSCVTHDESGSRNQHAPRCLRMELMRGSGLL